MKPINVRKSGALCFVVLAACGSVDQATPDAAAGDDAPPAGDDATDAAVPTGRCDVTKPFATPTLVPNINTSNDEFAFTTTRDELAGFVTHVVQSGPTATILATGRRTTDDDFALPNTILTSAINNATGNEHGASPTADGLLVYFHRQVGSVIAVLASARATGGKFPSGDGVFVDGKQLFNALSVTISADGTTLYWLDFNDFKLHSATRGLTPTSFTGDTIAATMPIGTNAVLTADELTLYYANGDGPDVLETTRASKNVPFAPGVPVANVNSPQSDYPTHLSFDGCVLYIVSRRAGGIGGPDIWEARRPL